MNDYIKFYLTEIDYEAEKPSLVEPWVAYTEDDEATHYGNDCGGGGSDDPYASKYLTLIPLQSTQFGLSKAPYQYSLDSGNTWTNVSSTSTTTPTVSPGTAVMFKGNLNSTSTYAGVGTFRSTSGYYKAEGNPLSLKYGDNFSGVTSDDTAGLFRGLFQDQTRLTDAENVVFMLDDVPTSGYAYMFAGCTNITKAPRVYAKTVGASGCCKMFSACTSLTDVQPMSAMTKACEKSCEEMFRGCSGLTTLPSDMLPATVLEANCYHNMFYDCSSLRYVPNDLLPAENLASHCYDGMFGHCGFVNGSELPALTAATLAEYCYQSMYAACYDMTTVPSDYLTAATMMAVYCYSGMFQACTGLTTLPDLPATMLADNCYNLMFYNCWSLTTIPSDYLPATTLENSCYSSMFNKCSGLTSIDLILPASKVKYHSYIGMFAGCKSLETVPSDMLRATSLDSSAESACTRMFSGCTSLTASPQVNINYTSTQSVYGALGCMFAGCSSLSYIDVRGVKRPTGGWYDLYQWLYGVASSGTLIVADGNSWMGSTCGDNVNYWPCGWTVQRV